MIKNILKVLVLIVFLNGCSNKTLYIDTNVSGVPKKRLEVYRYNKYEFSSNHKIKTKYIQWKNNEISKKVNYNAYNISFKRVKPYFVSSDYYVDYLLTDVALKPKTPWSRQQGFTPRAKYTDPYTFMMFTLNQEPYDKKLLPYFNTLNQTYETKLNPKDINQFVKYKCDKNIVFSKYERDENFEPLEATCYAKRLDKDVFLITRFAHPNTQEDRVLFKNEIIPTMLKSIKVTPTKLSPWKYY